MKTCGVLLMSLGTPENLDEMAEYLVNIRRGRPVSQVFVDEIRERYRQAGGRSPLLEITRRQAGALEFLLNESGNKFKVYVAMLYWRPLIQDIVAQALQDGMTRLISFPLTPYRSKLSTAVYHQRVREAMKTAGAGIEVIEVDGWNDNVFFIETYVSLLKEGLLKFSDMGAVRVLFTAHSLPEKILSEGDPYAEELSATIRLVADKANVKEYDFAYQSQGRTEDLWLSPTVEEMLARYADMGIRNVLLVPIGFVSDHMEILYDVDVLFKNIAREKNIRLERTFLPNDNLEFIKALQSVVFERFSGTEAKTNMS